MFTLLQAIIVLLYFILAGVLSATRSDSVGAAAGFGIFSIILVLYWLAVIIPSAASSCWSSCASKERAAPIASVPIH